MVWEIGGGAVEREGGNFLSARRKFCEGSDRRVEEGAGETVLRGVWASRNSRDILPFETGDCRNMFTCLMKSARRNE
jgi:hypothetical protein